MKLLIVTAVIAAVAAGPLLEQSSAWPWIVANEYRYEVDSYTWTKFENSLSNGNAFKGQLVVRVVAPGHLIAKLEHPQYAQIKDAESGKIPEGNYKPVEKIDQPFEIFTEEGRILSLNLPTSISVAQENLIKALVGSLQVDLSQLHSDSNNKETFQGLFKKFELDVTGDCETLYSVSPVSASWHRELPQFASKEAPIEVTKVKNYGSCQQRVAINYGVPEGYAWYGLATENEEKQFIQHTSEARLLVGKQGTIYKSETTTSVLVNPLLFGKQTSEIQTYTKFYLISVDHQNAVEWKKPEESRTVNSLLFTWDEAAFAPKGKYVANAQKLLQDLAPLLQKSGNIPKTNFLSKFNVLVKIISYMNSEQLTQLTNSVEVAKASKNVAKNSMWIIYRDAVAQAGTDAAFKEIKSWILTKKIQNEEASQVLTSLAASFWETTDIAPEFFEFAFVPEVYEQKFLNTSAFLAASRLSRFSDNNTFVVNEVIPRFAKELKQAVESGDSNKAQVFITVLGNLVRKEILQVYEPYLEGKIPISKYLRRQFVISLKNLANSKNEYVRDVLYSIFVNTAEPYEIRVAAFLNLILAFPTPEMFQKFALMTKYDPSTQVRAVIGNTISIAANLKDPRFAQLSKNAKSILTYISKEKYGYRYSTDSIMDVYTGDEGVTFLRELAFIGSEDNIFPKYQRFALRSRSTAWSEENQVTISASNVQQIVDYVKSLFSDPKKSTAEFKFSSKKVADILNIKRSSYDPLEGEIFVENWNQQKLLTFDDHLRLFIAQSYEQLRSGITKYQYTKVLNQRKALVTFPLASGMPFVLEYVEPLLFQAQGQIKLNIDGKGKSVSGSLENEFEITYSRNLEGDVGFIDTLGDAVISTGVVNKFQIHAPLKLDLLFTPEDYTLKISFLNTEQDSNLVHFSVSPYVSIKKTDYLLPALEEPATKLIKRPNKIISTDEKLGLWTGMFFSLKGYSYSSDYKDPTKLLSGDFLTNFGKLVYQEDVAWTNFDFKYLAESTNKIMKLNIFTDTLYDQNISGELAPAASLDHTIAYNDAGRRLEIANRAAQGIKSAEVKIFDISALFEGSKNCELSLTAALAESHFDAKYQGAFFVQTTDQTNVVFKIVKPKIVPLNFEEALKNDIKFTYEVDFKFGNASNVLFKGYGERSEQYKSQLLNDPKAKSCLLESSKKNFYQLDCYKMLVKAHAPDFFKATIISKESPNFLVQYFYNVISYWFSQYEVEFAKGSANIKNGVEFEAHAHYYDKYVDYDFKTNDGIFRLKNVEGMAYYPYATAIYGPLNGWERSRNWFTGYQNIPFCVVDDNIIRTFSGRAYNYSLSSSWHVVMVDEANQLGQWTDLVILARRPSENQEEVYISYKAENGKYLEVEIKPSVVNVKSDVKKVIEGLYKDEGAKAAFFEYYDLANGVKVFEIDNGVIRIVYDNQRLVIFTDSYRSYNRGVCGQSSSQVQADYLTPWGIVDQPDLYGASFSLDGEFSDPKTLELKEQAKLKAYQPFTKYTTLLKNVH